MTWGEGAILESTAVGVIAGVKESAAALAKLHAAAVGAAAATITSRAVRIAGTMACSAKGVYYILQVEGAHSGRYQLLQSKTHAGTLAYILTKT